MAVVVGMVLVVAIVGCVEVVLDGVGDVVSGVAVGGGEVGSIPATVDDTAAGAD